METASPTHSTALESTAAPCLLDLPAEVLITIIAAARCCGRYDLITLYGLSRTCWRLRRFMLARHDDITATYMYIETGTVTAGTYHMFAGMYHNLDDRPAIEYIDGERIWCRYNKPWRAGGLPQRISAHGLRTWLSSIDANPRIWYWTETHPARVRRQPEAL